MNDMFEYNAFYRDELKNKTTDLLAELDTRATQVDGGNLFSQITSFFNSYILFADYIYVLLNKAQREFHEMFTRTYGKSWKRRSI